MSKSEILHEVPYQGTKKLKVLHIITSTVGGAGIHVYYLTKFINQEHFETAVAFTPGQHLDHLFNDNDVALLPLQMSRSANLYRMWLDCWTLYRYLKEHQVDIVHTHNTLAGLVGRLAAKLAGVPVVIHMIHTFAAHPYSPTLQKFLYLKLEQLWDYFTTYYIAGSHFICQKAIQKQITAPGKICTIHYAVDTDSFLSIAIDSESLMKRRQVLGLSESDKVIGFVGRLEEQKGPDIFLHAVALVRQVYPEAHVLLIGDGPLRPELEAMCCHLNIQNHVHFLGWRRDIPELLSIIDVFSLASRWEAFGIVFAEAGIMGKPSVASHVEGIPEVVINGKGGVLVHGHAPEDLAEALIAVLADPPKAQKMGQFAREHVLRHFSITNMITAHEKLYKSLAL